MAKEDEKQPSFWIILISNVWFWVVLGLLVIGATVASISISYQINNRMFLEKAMEQGYTQQYTQQSLPGQTSVYWVKDEKKLEK